MVKQLLFGIAALGTSVLLPFIAAGLAYEGTEGYERNFEITLPHNSGYINISPVTVILTSIPFALLSSYLGCKALESAWHDFKNISN